MVAAAPKLRISNSVSSKYLKIRFHSCRNYNVDLRQVMFDYV